MLKKPSSIFLIFLVTLNIFIKCEIPTIDVFMECLCPHCQGFVTGSFARFLRNPSHSSLAKVRFFPYGNAEETEHDGHYEFDCQHGENECYGNVVEVCALEKLEYEAGLHFMVCMEKGIRKYDENINKALTYCVKDSNMLHKILKCASGNEGNSLQHKVAKATPSNNQYVPWILFNGTHDEKIEAQILENMTAFLCGLEQNKNSPDCQGVEQISFINLKISHTYKP